VARPAPAAGPRGQNHRGPLNLTVVRKSR
jgi:hypothetical protein